MNECSESNLMTKLKTKQSFKEAIENQAIRHIEELMDLYGYGWELYMKCDTNGNVRFCPKGEVWVKQT